MQLQIDESNLLFNCPIKNKVIKEEENEEEDEGAAERESRSEKCTRKGM